MVMEDEIIEYREIINEINERYKDTPLQASMAKGEVFPSNVAPVLVRGEGAPQASLMKWGFPKFRGKGMVINARSETALEKQLFRKPLLEHRCLAPAAGFFEWRQEEGKKKAKYLFRLNDAKMLYLAGFYERFTAGKTPYDAYVILTTAANASVAPYHDRMPLILERDLACRWLSDTSFALDHLHIPCETMLQADQADRGDGSGALD